MQNKYVGDIGDYCKLGLLRWLSGAHPDTCQKRFSLGVGWYAVPDNFDAPSNRDGRHIDYLGLKHSKDEGIIDHPDSALLRHLDPFLWDRLKETVLRGRREISELETILNDGGNRGFHNERLPITANWRARAELRKAWAHEMIGCLRNRDLLFLDPDNGLVSEKMRPTSKKIVKHILLDELHQLCQLAKLGLVFYHHLGQHTPHSEQMATLRERLKCFEQDWVISSLIFNRNTCRAFIMLTRRSSVSGSELQRRFNLFIEKWRRPEGAVVAP